MPEPIFPGSLELERADRTPPRWIKRRIRQRAHRLAMDAFQGTYHQAVTAMLLAWHEKKLDVRLIDFWEPAGEERT